MMTIQDQRQKQIYQILLITFVLNLLVCAAKLVYGIATKSLSLEADGFHSLVDASSNVVAFFAVFFASRPPDEKHPYGHRKIEAMASLFISGMLFLVCYEILSGVYARIKNPVIPTISLLSFVIMFATLAVNYFVSRFEMKKGGELKSEVLLADAMHTRSDIFVSLSVLASFVGVLLKVPMVDWIVAFGLVLFIFFAAFKIITRSLNILLDAQIIDPQKIMVLVMQIKGIEHCHKIRSRGTQSGIFVDLHIHVDPMLTTEKSHELTHKVINTIKVAFPQVLDVLIHTEPSHPPSQNQPGYPQKK